MIYKMTMYACQCDNCGKQWHDDHDTEPICYTDELTMKEMVMNNDDWHVDGNKQYCTDCFYIDDNDRVYIKEISKTNAKHVEKGYWNGMRADISACEVKINAIPDKPMYWNNAFAQEIKQALEITQDGYTFLIYNEDGSGYEKATKGMGMWRSGHKAIENFEFIAYLPAEMWVRVVNEAMMVDDHKKISEYQQKADPEGYSRLQGLIEARKEFERKKQL